MFHIVNKVYLLSLVQSLALWEALPELAGAVAEGPEAVLAEIGNAELGALQEFVANEAIEAAGPQ